MTVKKPDNSDDATDDDYINDKTDEDYPEDAIHEIHIYDETIVWRLFWWRLFYDKTDEDYPENTIDEDCAHPQFPRWLQSAASIVLLQWPPYCLQWFLLFLYITKNWVAVPPPWFNMDATGCYEV